MMTMIRNTAAMLVLAAGLAACAQPETPEDRYYRLDVSGPAKALDKPVLAGTVQVDRFSVDGLIGQSQIVYVANGKGHELQTYHYHYWTEPPAILLQDQLIAYLRAAHVADHVVTPEMRVDVDYVLTGKVKRLEQVTGGAPKAVVELEMGLRRAADGKLMYLATERAEAAAASETVGDGVAAANTALATIYARVVAGLQAAK